MIGIENIGIYFPEARHSNFERKDEFQIDDHFITDKIGVQQIGVKAEAQNTSDLCVEAYKALSTKVELNKDEIDAIIVVTQNPDENIPHTSAVVHGKLDMPEQCACFDISLGCSGFVYGLSVMESLLKEQGLKKGLLFTADPYSKIIDRTDKNTSLLFGDAAAVALISQNAVFTSGEFNFGTIGKLREELICREGKLFMNGRSIFEFAAKYVPKDIDLLLKKNQLINNDVDLYLFHQGSKYIIDTLTKRLRLPVDKVPFLAAQYGNTVSSSIPIMLNEYLEKKEFKRIVVSGFGVGLSWASTILKRV